MDQQPPTTPQPSAPPEPAAPPPVQAASGWAQPPPPPPQAPSGWGQAPAAGTAWVMPQDAAIQGAVTGLSKLGAVVLILFGALWTLIGLLFVLIGAGINSLGDSFGDPNGLVGLGDVVGGVLVGFGVVILAISLVEIATGVFAWRGNGPARVVGIAYGLLFGLGCLFSAVAGTRSDEARGGAVFLLVLAIGYLYTAAVFIVRWRQRP